MVAVFAVIAVSSLSLAADLGPLCLLGVVENREVCPGNFVGAAILGKLNADALDLVAVGASLDPLEVGRCSLAQFLVLHPPYDDIIKFSDRKEDLSNCQSTEDFYELFENVARNGYEMLEKGRHAALIIGDKYANGELIPLGFGCMERMQRCGFMLKSIIVKNIEGNEKAKGKQANLWRYRALYGGFYIFKHEYVMIFQKM